MKKKTAIICLIILAACTVMGIVDAVWKPGYYIKSAIKVLQFILLPVLYLQYDRSLQWKRLFRLKKKGLWIALAAGAGIYGVVLSAYFIARNFFDFSGLTESLQQTTGGNAMIMLFGALYISFANSLLEELFFRGFGFLILKEHSGRLFAYLFSAFTFAAYHTAMMIGWFGVPVISLTLLGLFLGGLIFNWIDDRGDNIYLSWLVHMFANFATNTVGLIAVLGK